LRKINLLNSLRHFIPRHKKCFLLSFLCALNIACGKKARYPASEEAKLIDELTSNSKVLTVSDQSPVHQIEAEANSIVTLPEKIDILEGSQAGHEAYLSFNIDEKEQFYCVYRVVGNYFGLDDCYENVDDDEVDEPLGMEAGDKFVQVKDKAYKLELSFIETNGPIKAQVELNVAPQ